MPRSASRSSRTNLQPVVVSVERLIVADLVKTIRCLHKRCSRLASHVLFEITVGEFQSDLSVVRIEIGNLVENVECTLVVARLCASIGDYEILRASWTRPWLA